MKKSIVALLLSLCLILSFSSPSEAQSKPADTSGVYVGILGGYVIPMDMKTTVTGSGGSINYDIALDKGYLLGAKVGYLTPFTNRIMALELEYNHIRNSFDTSKGYTFNGQPVRFDSKTQVDAVMVNVLGRYPEGKFHPYVGIGGGYANVKVSDMDLSVMGIKALSMSSGSKGVFAYQFLLGVDCDIADNFVLGLQYKYLATAKASYDGTVTSPFVASFPASVDAEYKAHNLVLSLSYLF